MENYEFLIVTKQRRDFVHTSFASSRFVCNSYHWLSLASETTSSVYKTKF